MWRKGCLRIGRHFSLTSHEIRYYAILFIYSKMGREKSLLNDNYSHITRESELKLYKINDNAKI